MCKELEIILINPPSDCISNDRLEPPLGLLYIASNLRQNMCGNVSVIDMSGYHNNQKSIKRFKTIPVADIYGITNMCTNYKYTKKIIRYIRSFNPSAYIVLGGAHSSGIPDFVWKDSGADVIAVGEGEDLFIECVDSYSNGSVFKGIIVGKPRRDIDSYVFPARDLVDLATYSRTLMGLPTISLISSRGCQYRCAHCNSIVMGGGSNDVRYRSIKNIIEEIKMLRDQFDCFRFNDDHFTGNPLLPELLQELESLNIKFRIFARIEDLDDMTCKQLKKAGCVHVSIGLESLNPDNLKILGKASQKGMEGNVNIAKSYGLVTRASFMVGLPYDTDDTIDKYFYKASQLGLDEFAVYPLIPYPGTLIWKYPKRFGYTIINSHFADYVQIGKNGLTCYALKHENFTPKNVEIWKLKTEQILESGGIKHMRRSEVAV